MMTHCHHVAVHVYKHSGIGRERRVREPVGSFRTPGLVVFDLPFICLEHSGRAALVCKGGWEI